jgi:superoxide dismutase, Cu-Zn family
MSKPVIAAAALLVGLATALSACNNQPASKQQTTTTTPSSSQPASAERLTAELKSADGTPVANATFEFANGYATVTVEAAPNKILTPGFHGMHIHSVGKCDANSVAPTGGSPADFASAGGHFQVPGHNSHPASGDLSSLEVRKDGAAKLVTTTDTFTAADLLGGEKTALIIHQDPDNFAHIPQRYTVNGAAGPDQETMSTGDAGKRVACGVIGGTASSTSTSTSTSTVTTTAAVPPATETTTNTGQATTTTTTTETTPPTTSTSTSTVTVTSSTPVTTTPTP